MSGNDSVLDALGPTARAIDLPGASVPPSPIERGARRFVARELLGRGGLGEVYEAYDADLRRPVALKRPRDATSPAAVAMLLREAQVTAQLDHPNVPAVHALGLDEERRAFFAMTLVRGRSLRDAIGDPSFGAARALRVFLQIAYAVAAAHRRGVVHRDLKPDNVMLGALGEVRVMDWGIAKLLDRDDDAIQLAHELDARTQAGSVVGTPGYAPPEQLGRGAVDGRADVFALGVLLYEMLYRRPLFEGTPVQRVADTLEGRRPAPRPTPAIRAPLVAIVEKAIAHRPEDRYPDVPSLTRDVEAYLDGELVSVEPHDPLALAGWFWRMRADRLRRFRPIHVDLIVFGHLAIGAGLALLAAALTALPSLVLGPALAAIGLVMVSFPAWTLLRPRRPDDPVESAAVREGVATDDRR